MRSDRGLLLALLALVSAGLLVPPQRVQAGGGDWPPAPRLDWYSDDVDDDIGLLPPSISATHTGNEPWKVTFRYRPHKKAKRIALAGSFNSWNQDRHRLNGPDDNGDWSIEMTLGPGEYTYKFVVDGEWVADPLNPKVASDGYGNSLLHLGRIATLETSTGKVRDGRIETIALAHAPESPSFFLPITPSRVLIRYRTLAHDVAHVWVAIRDGALTPMHPVLNGPLFTFWEATVDLPDSTRLEGTKDVREVKYTFVLADPDQKRSHPNEFVRRFNETDVFETPAWARDAIWYQIMVDRFRNGSTTNDPENARPWTGDWFEPSEWEGKDGETFYDSYVFRRLYGGDIDGLEAMLPYLRELGVNALYLNPVFQSPSHHKYNATSYVHIDEHYGVGGDYADAEASEKVHDDSTWVWSESDKRFLAFLKKAKSMGFRVIFDGVFNHVGDSHPAFRHVKEHGQSSPYADWFDVTGWKPFEYRGWAGFGDLPVFRKSESEGLASTGVRDHIYSVTRRWMDPDGDGDPSDGIDGWRLDVPNEIPMIFWEHWRDFVKRINPDAYITGEIWDRADLWVGGRHFDAVMNYQFAQAAIGWIVDRTNKISASEIDRRLAELRMAYPAPATYVMQNLIDSHDTDRVASMAYNPDRKYDHENRVQDSNSKYNDEKPDAQAYARTRLIVLLQMTYVGAPMVYYGDEVGMWGADDPTCRKPMLWADLQPYEKPEENFVMPAQLGWYRAAIALRRDHPALRTGAFRTLLVDDAKDVWVFSRFDRREHLIVALNASGKEQVVDVALEADAPGRWTTAFRGGLHVPLTRGGDRVDAKANTIRLTAPAIGGTVLVASGE